MSKTIKVIDLLNKIANGEELPKKIKYKDKIFIYCSNTRKYYNENIDLFLEFYSGELLNDEAEIIEEQEEIDIQNIEEIEPAMNGNAYVIDNKTWTLNQVIKAVKQLDKKIKEK